MTSLDRLVLWVLLCGSLPACSILVDGTLNTRGGPDGGMVGETCTTDEQCISFDPFNCNRVCGAAGRCVDGTAAPDGTRCGNGAPPQHCVAGACVMRACGDGFVDRNATPPEYCDDGNTNPDDGCNNVCTRSCVAPAPANCDDGNPCNGTEMCVTAVGLCRAMEMPADGMTCSTGGTSGTCVRGTCTP